MAVPSRPLWDYIIAVGVVAVAVSVSFRLNEARTEVPFVRENRSQIVLGDFVERTVGRRSTYSRVDLKPDESLILFGYGDAACPPCIYEIQEYVFLLDSLRVRLRAGIVLLGRDSARAEIEYDVIGFGLPSIRPVGGTLSDTLRRWGDREFDSQIAFLRLTDSTVTYRGALLNRVTPRSHKLEVLRAGLSSLLN